MMGQTSTREHRGNRSTVARGAVALLLFVALGLAALGQTACRGGPRTSVAGTEVAARDTMRGRLVDGRQSQSFTIDGVESSVLDFELKSDEASLSAPVVSLLDPEGGRVSIAPYLKTAEGAATMKVEGVVLLRTGTYQVTVTPPSTCADVYYRFTHSLSFPPMERIPVLLTACDEHPVYVSAPRGGMVTVIVAPKDEGAVQPEFRAVQDPWGGRALDPTRRPAGGQPATVTTGRDGSVYLNFTAPIPGRYTVVTAAKQGSSGAAFVSTRVQAAGGTNRAVYHPNRPAEAFGVPAAGSGSDR